MAVHVRKKCPHCGKTYESYSTYTKQTHYGSPFLNCSYCNKTFIDKEIKEPALKPYKALNYTFMHCLLTGLFPFCFISVIGIGAGIQNLSSQEHDPALFFIIGGIALVIYLFLVLFAYSKRNELKEDWEKEYKVSEQRLQNKSYAMAMKNAGFKVPSKYLES